MRRSRPNRWANARPSHASLLFALFLALWLPVANARADEPNLAPTRPNWAFNSTVAEGAVLALSITSNATFFIPQHKGRWDSRHRHLPEPTASLASDIIGSAAGSALQASTGYVLETTYLNAEHAHNPGLEALHGSLVEFESVLLTNGITTLIKRLTGRCRPRAYHDNICDEFDAFPSGHTSPIAAIAGARLVRVFETPFHSQLAGLRVANVAIAEVGMTATALLRVAAGAHSLEDVVVGALVGQSTGILIALMHPPSAASLDAGRIVPTQTSASAFVMTWSGSF
jgi:hypothetical protein